MRDTYTEEILKHIFHCRSGFQMEECRANYGVHQVHHTVILIPILNKHQHVQPQMHKALRAIQAISAIHIITKTLKVL